MNPRTRLFLILGAAALAVAVCVFVLPPILPPIYEGANASPTFTPVKPTTTFTPPASRPTATSTLTPLALAAAPAVPSPFDIILNFTNGTCGGGGTPSYSYTFTIDGTSLTVLQTDAGITSSGSFDPVTGAFSTSADVGPGDETYDGYISFDSTTISVKGSYTWTPDGGQTCGADVAGTTTP